MENEFFNLFKLNNNEFTTQKIQIEENLLRFDNFTLQLSNISQIYAGERKFQIPRWSILAFIVSIFALTKFPQIGMLGVLISGGYIFVLFQDHTKQRLYLSFSLNSGKLYELRFSEHKFLAAVREEVEAAFNSKRVHSVINIAEQKIVNGDHHEVYGDHTNINAGVQSDNVVHSHNEGSYNTTDDSFTMGDIQNSSIHSAAFGSENVVTTKESSYQWDQLQQDLQAVFASLKDESSMKIAVAAALAAVQQQDQKIFEKTIKHYRAEFMSGVFKDVASGLLVQVVAGILGLA
jgi:hypothetical protein